VERPLARTIFSNRQTELSVLLLNNLDHSWPQVDIDQCLTLGDMMVEAMQAGGTPFDTARFGGCTLSQLLSAYDQTR